mmetsp:Transcript_747/g.2855  ORF Transcript_747/g.2855 Transcript_747/m.2855 type:complete len:252 (-) Transcript_747:22-777(-)
MWTAEQTASQPSARCATSAAWSFANRSAGCRSSASNNDTRSAVADSRQRFCAAPWPLPPLESTRRTCPAAAKRRAISATVGDASPASPGQGSSRTKWRSAAGGATPRAAFPKTATGSDSAALFSSSAEPASCCCCSCVAPSLPVAPLLPASCAAAAMASWRERRKSPEASVLPSSQMKTSNLQPTLLAKSSTAQGKNGIAFLHGMITEICGNDPAASPEAAPSLAMDRCQRCSTHSRPPHALWARPVRSYN